MQHSIAPQHELNHELGDEGRGLVTPWGEIHTWGAHQGYHMGVMQRIMRNHDLDPMQADRYQNKGERQGDWSFFYINPEGQIGTWFGQHDDNQQVGEDLRPGHRELLEQHGLTMAPTQSWVFGAVKHHLNHVPGEWGKGLITPEGELHTWATSSGTDPYLKWSYGHDDGTPSHYAYMASIGIDPEQKPRTNWPTLMFAMDPDGSVNPYDTPDPRDEELLKQHLDYENNQGWHFGAVLPEVIELPHKEITKDYALDNFMHRRPWAYDKGEGRVYLGYPGMFHYDLGRELSYPDDVQYGSVVDHEPNPGGDFATDYGEPGTITPFSDYADNKTRPLSEDAVKALQKHLGPGYVGSNEGTAYFEFAGSVLQQEPNTTLEPDRAKIAFAPSLSQVQQSKLTQPVHDTNSHLAALPEITLHDIPAGAAGHEYWPASGEMDDMAFATRRPWLYENGHLYRGEPDQHHNDLWADAAALGHSINEPARGYHGFGDDPDEVGFFGQRLKSEWKDAIVNTLNGKIRPEDDWRFSAEWARCKSCGVQIDKKFGQDYCFNCIHKLLPAQQQFQLHIPRVYQSANVANELTLPNATPRQPYQPWSNVSPSNMHLQTPPVLPEADLSAIGALGYFGTGTISGTFDRHTAPAYNLDITTKHKPKYSIQPNGMPDPWSLGNSGKGVINSDGSVITWNGDGVEDFHHGDFGIDPCMPFMINPQGEVEDVGSLAGERRLTEKDIPLLKAHNPDLRIQAPWRFGRLRWLKSKLKDLLAGNPWEQESEYNPGSAMYPSLISEPVGPERLKLHSTHSVEAWEDRYGSKGSSLTDGIDRVGSSNVMYHVAPKEHRKKIEHEGLRPSWGGGFATGQTPLQGIPLSLSGVYLTNDPTNIGVPGTTFDPSQHDVWEVNINGLSTEPDWPAVVEHGAYGEPDHIWFEPGHSIGDQLHSEYGERLRPNELAQDPRWQELTNTIKVTQPIPPERIRRVGSSNEGHQINHTPDQWAKGMITPEGQIHTWDTAPEVDPYYKMPLNEWDGAPSHVAYMMQHGMMMDRHNPDNLMFRIRPDNTFTLFGDPPSERNKELLKSIGWQEPWSFSSSSDHSIGKQSTMTLPQEQKRWNEIRQHKLYDEGSTSIHQWNDGWSVRRANDHYAAGAIGDMLRNCWQGYDRGGFAYDKKQGVPPHSLHDEYGIPRAAFYINDAGSILSPLGRNNQPIDEAIAARLSEIGKVYYSDDPHIRTLQHLHGLPNQPDELRGQLGEPERIGHSSENLAYRQSQQNGAYSLPANPHQALSPRARTIGTTATVPNPLEPWSPGNYGKGIASPNSVTTWNTNAKSDKALYAGGPHHQEVMRTLNLHDRDQAQWQYDIYPDGTVTHAYGTKPQHIDTLLAQHHKDLHPSNNWSFSSVGRVPLKPEDIINEAQLIKGLVPPLGTVRPNSITGSHSGSWGGGPKLVHLNDLPEDPDQDWTGSRNPFAYHIPTNTVYVGPLGTHHFAFPKSKHFPIESEQDAYGDERGMIRSLQNGEWLHGNINNGWEEYNPRNTLKPIKRPGGVEWWRGDGSEHEPVLDFLAQQYGLPREPKEEFKFGSHNEPGPERVLYHQSPYENRDRIKQWGLIPQSREGEDKVWFMEHPNTSHHPDPRGYNPEADWDMWEVRVPENWPLEQTWRGHGVWTTPKAIPPNQLTLRPSMVNWRWERPEEGERLAASPKVISLTDWEGSIAKSEPLRNRMPFAYYEPSDAVYLGPKGGFHSDLANWIEFHKGDGPVSYGQVDTGSPEGWQDYQGVAGYSDYGGPVELPQRVLDAVSEHTGIPLSAGQGEGLQSWKFGHVRNALRARYQDTYKFPEHKPSEWRFANSLTIRDDVYKPTGWDESSGIGTNRHAILYKPEEQTLYIGPHNSTHANIHGALGDNDAYDFGRYHYYAYNTDNGHAYRLTGEKDPTIINAIHDYFGSKPEEWRFGALKPNQIVPEGLNPPQPNKHSKGLRLHDGTEYMWSVGQDSDGLPWHYPVRNKLGLSDEDIADYLYDEHNIDWHFARHGAADPIEPTYESIYDIGDDWDEKPHAGFQGRKPFAYVPKTGEIFVGADGQFHNDLKSQIIWGGLIPKEVDANNELSFGSIIHPHESDPTARHYGEPGQITGRSDQVYQPDPHPKTLSLLADWLGPEYHAATDHWHFSGRNDVKVNWAEKPERGWHSLWYNPASKEVYTAPGDWHHYDIAKHFGLELHDPESTRQGDDYANSEGLHTGWYNSSYDARDMEWLHRNFNEAKDLPVINAIRKDLGLEEFQSGQTDQRWKFGSNPEGNTRMADYYGDEESEPAEVRPYEPGQWGKGIITPEDEIHTWRVGNKDGLPSHQGYAKQQLGRILQDEGFGPGRWRCFTISQGGQALPYGWSTASASPEDLARVQQQLGEAKPEASTEWRFGSSDSFEENLQNLRDEAEPWSHGEYGKGFVHPNGQIVHWGVGEDPDGYPWHTDAMDGFGLQKEYGSLFGIHPDGRVMNYGDQFFNEISFNPDWEEHMLSGDQMRAVQKHIDPGQERWKFGGVEIGDYVRVHPDHPRWGGMEGQTVKGPGGRLTRGMVWLKLKKGQKVGIPPQYIIPGRISSALPTVESIDIPKEDSELGYPDQWDDSPYSYKYDPELDHIYVGAEPYVHHVDLGIPRSVFRGAEEQGLWSPESGVVEHFGENEGNTNRINEALNQHFDTSQEFRFGSRTEPWKHYEPGPLWGERAEWEPGRWGKGVWRPNEGIALWGLGDGNGPHHSDMVEDHVPVEGGGTDQPFEVEPNGTVVMYNPNQILGHEDELRLALSGVDSRLQLPENLWHLGSTPESLYPANASQYGKAFHDKPFDLKLRPWKPKYPGKGILFDDGSISTWGVSQQGDPHHWSWDGIPFTVWENGQIEGFDDKDQQRLNEREKDFAEIHPQMKPWSGIFKAFSSDPAIHYHGEGPHAPIIYLEDENEIHVGDPSWSFFHEATNVTEHETQDTYWDWHR